MVKLFSFFIEDGFIDLGDYMRAPVDVVIEGLKNSATYTLDKIVVEGNYLSVYGTWHERVDRFIRSILEEAHP